MDINAVLNTPLSKLSSERPVFNDFLLAFRIDAETEYKSFSELLDAMPSEYWSDQSISRHEILGLFVDFAKGILTAEEEEKINCLEICGGIDKSGIPESSGLLLKPGEITCIVGPTGSGKSRLLADIEWLANRDTPTKRQVLINGQSSSDALLNAFGGKLVAQITQNMNFVMDMDVYNFLLLHAHSRMIENAQMKVEQVISLANELSGEPFEPNTPVTFLSGGQSRALMIADVACIGQAPIVLIDEIENAGVDKRKALELLVSQEKIVLMATHDPLLILLADKRVVIRNGGIHKVIFTNEHEKLLYNQLEELDNTMQMARNFFRKGNELYSAEQISRLDGYEDLSALLQ